MNQADETIEFITRLHQSGLNKLLRAGDLLGTPLANSAPPGRGQLVAADVPGDAVTHAASLFRV